MKNETKEIIIDVNEESVNDSRPTDIPQISIERGPQAGKSPRRLSRLVITLICVAALGLLAAFFALATKRSSSGIYPRENLQTLNADYHPTAVGTECFSDTILGVPMNIFPLSGLRASLEGDLPDPGDSTLVLFMRSADYRPDGTAMGPLVADGEYSDWKAAKLRDGYVAVSPAGRAVIGVYSGDEVEKWAVKNGGDFFRQQVLLVDGELPRDFLLRGKVERAAIASAVNGQLFYVVTHGRESMYDFADALREYGFVNAVYMTGGNAYSFYRDPQGRAHLNQPTEEKLEKYRTQPLPQPLLVFRRSLH